MSGHRYTVKNGGRGIGVCTWNIEGLSVGTYQCCGDKAESILMEICMSKSAVIWVLTETKLTQEQEYIWYYQCERKKLGVLTSGSNDESGHSATGGISVVWKRFTESGALVNVELESIVVKGRLLKILVTIGNDKFKMTCVYGVVRGATSDIESFWDTVGQCVGPNTILIGDMNANVNSPDRPQDVGLQTLTDALGGPLRDFWATQERSDPTYYSGDLSSRIDYCLAGCSVVNQWSPGKVYASDFTLTRHRIVESVYECNTPVRSKRIPRITSTSPSGVLRRYRETLERLAREQPDADIMLIQEWCLTTARNILQRSESEKKTFTSTRQWVHVWRHQLNQVQYHGSQALKTHEWTRLNHLIHSSSLLRRVCGSLQLRHVESENEVTRLVDAIAHSMEKAKAKVQEREATVDRQTTKDFKTNLARRIAKNSHNVGIYFPSEVQLSDNGDVWSGEEAKERLDEFGTCYWEAKHVNLRAVNSMIRNLPTKQCDQASYNNIFSWKVFQTCLSRMRNFKAVGGDGFAIELLKMAPSNIQRMYWVNMVNAIQQGVYPEQWNLGLVYLIYKGKGNRLCPDNYRPITVLPHGMKLLALMLLCHVMKQMDLTILPNQAGFRKARDSLEMVADLMWMMDAAKSERGEICVLYADFRRAYDQVDHNILQLALRKAGVHEVICRLVGVIYANARGAYVMSDGGYTKGFAVGRGVRQGCPLSPLFFNLYLDLFARLLIYRNPGLKINAYADDVAIKTNNIRAMQLVINTMKEWLEATGTEINLDANGTKTAWTYRDWSRRNNTKQKLWWGDCAIPFLLPNQPYKYLGFWLRLDCTYHDAKRDFWRRLNAALLSVSALHLHPEPASQMIQETFRGIVSYYGANLPLNEHDILITDRILRRHIGRVLHLARDTPILALHDDTIVGGLNIVHSNQVIVVARLNLIRRLYTSPYSGSRWTYSRMKAAELKSQGNSPIEVDFKLFLTATNISLTNDRPVPLNAVERWPETDPFVIDPSIPANHRRDLETLSNPVIQTLENFLKQSGRVIVGSDGSKSDRGVSWGVYGGVGKWTGGMLPKDWSVYGAELYGVWQALRHLKGGSRVAVLCDNLGAVQMVSRTLSGYVVSLKDKWADLLHAILAESNRFKEVSVLWIKGHAGWIPNLCADWIASNVDDHATSDAVPKAWLGVRFCGANSGQAISQLAKHHVKSKWIKYEIDRKPVHQWRIIRDDMMWGETLLSPPLLSYQQRTFLLRWRLGRVANRPSCPLDSTELLCPWCRKVHKTLSTWLIGWSRVPRVGEDLQQRWSRVEHLPQWSELANNKVPDMTLYQAFFLQPSGNEQYDMNQAHELVALLKLLHYLWIQDRKNNLQKNPTDPIEQEVMDE
jgi:hypothetical protein